MNWCTNRTSAPDAQWPCFLGSFPIARGSIPWGAAWWKRTARRMGSLGHSQVYLWRLGSRRMSRVAFGGFGRFFSQTVLISTLKNRLNRYGSGGFWYLRPMNSHQPCLRKAYWACHPHTLTHGSDWRQRDATSMPTWAIPCNSQILAL